MAAAAQQTNVYFRQAHRGLVGADQNIRRCRHGQARPQRRTIDGADNRLDALTDGVKALTRAA